jgi:hypothetical protein
MVFLKQLEKIFGVFGGHLIYLRSFFFCYVEISQITTSLVTLLVLLESHSQAWVHQVGFIMFKPLVEKLWNIEHYFYRELI